MIFTRRTFLGSVLAGCMVVAARLYAVPEVPACLEEEPACLEEEPRFKMTFYNENPVRVEFFINGRLAHTAYTDQSGQLEPLVVVARRDDAELTYGLI